MSAPIDDGGAAKSSDSGQAIEDDRLRIEKLYHNLIDSSLGLICSHDLDGNLLMVNHAAAEALGYSPEEMTGRNYREFIPSPFVARFDNYIAKIVREGTARGYLSMMTRSGEQVTWLYRNKLYCEPGKPTIVLGHAQDVTWRLEMEQRLRESNENYRRLFEDAPVAYHEIDSQGVIVKLNRAECKLLGFEKADLLGKPVWDLVAPEQRESSKAAVLRKLAGQQDLIPFFREYIRGDGTRRVLNIHEKAIRSADGTVRGIRSTLLDVTEQVFAEQELRRLNADLDKLVADRTHELNASNSRMREFVYTVSHDLQEPLRSIGSFAKLLREGYAARLDADGVEFLDFVTSGAQRMSKLVRDLLAYSRALHDEAANVEDVPLTRVLEIVEEILARSIKDSGAGLFYGDLPVVRANPQRMVQIFQNLIGNAIKYRGDRPLVIRVEASREERVWQISITDNGIGVPEKDRERIFGLFKRTQGGGAPGSGVGLAICQAIIERYGGRIWVEPVAERGSRFTFTLPI